MPSSPVQRRFFLCTGQCVVYKDLYKYPSSHILGELRYITYQSRKVTALAIYLVPISAVIVPPVNPVIVDYTLVSPMVECRYADCKRTQNWEIGKAGMMALMDRMGYQEKFLEMERKEKEHEPVA